MKKIILIASNSSDHPTVQPVAALLEAKGYDVIIYECDRVSKGEVSFNMQFIGGGLVEYMYDGRRIDPTVIHAAWSRRPTDFRSAFIDVAKELYLAREKRESQDLFLRSINENVWLNAPDKITLTEHKLWQLQQAALFGFQVPRTIITNGWDDVLRYFSKDDKIIFKMPYGEISINNEMHVMGAKVLEINNHNPPNVGTPFPGICQQYVTKKREWRVTIVGDKVFSAAIHTHEKAKDDWRQHQYHDELVQFKNGTFPKNVSDQCVAFLAHLGLKFGAYDFVEDDEGNFVFLEVNSNGQYGWIEKRLGLPISTAIANQLSEIAEAY